MRPLASYSLGKAEGQRGRGTDLGHAVWTEPVSLRHLRELGSQAVHVAAAVAAVTQQQALVVVALLANLAGLEGEEPHLLLLLQCPKLPIIMITHNNYAEVSISPYLNFYPKKIYIYIFYSFLHYRYMVKISTT